jgi:hypothetical protein
VVNSDAMRADDSEELLAGYVSGPAAATEATLAALPRAAAARAVVLVEGVSDQIAVETLAARHGRDLAVEGIVVLPTGGVHGMTRYLRRFGPEGTGARLAGLCDAAEEHIVRRGLAAAGLGSPGSRADLERLGFFVCVRDEAAQLRRFLGAGSQRKLRYARLLTEAIDTGRIPRPLEAVLSAA